MIVEIKCYNCGTQRSRRWHATTAAPYDSWCDGCANECEGHVAHPDNNKVCAKCGTHIDELSYDAS